MITAHETSSFTKGSRRNASRPKIAAPSSAGPEPASAPASEPAEVGRLQEALRKSELKNRALLNTIADFVFSIRKDGAILEFQAPNDGQFTVPADGVIGRRIMELLPIQLAQQAMYYLEKALRTGETQTFTCQYLLPGRVRDWQIRITRSGPGEVLALVRDVTDHKVLEKEIVEITNKVQARIGQDLHDGLGQHLTGITFLTRALENKLSAKSLPEAADAAEVGRLVIQALSQTRNLARGLFPVELESNGLIPAFRELATTVENLFSISCVLECDENLKVANLAVATHLFRLAQEAINNSVKHGKAKRVVVRLHKADGKVVLAISDDGQGFPRKEIKLNGLGLRIMNYRSQKIGATLDIQPGERGGTVVTCSLPNAGRE